MVSTFSRIQTALERVTFPHVCMKPMQVNCWENILMGNDLVVVLPTGYGKSFIFQLLPFLLPVKSSRNIVIVAAPLTSIIQDQMLILSRRNIVSMVFHSSCIAEEMPRLFITEGTKQKHSDTENTAGGVSVDQNVLAQGKMDILFGHPEGLLSEDGRRLLSSPVFKENVVAMVVDEAHCVVTW